MVDWVPSSDLEDATAEEVCSFTLFLLLLLLLASILALIFGNDFNL